MLMHAFSWPSCFECRWYEILSFHTDHHLRWILVCAIQTVLYLNRKRDRLMVCLCLILGTITLIVSPCLICMIFVNVNMMKSKLLTFLYSCAYIFKALLVLYRYYNAISDFEKSYFTITLLEWYRFFVRLYPLSINFVSRICIHFVIATSLKPNSQNFEFRTDFVASAFQTNLITVVSVRYGILSTEFVYCFNKTNWKSPTPWRYLFYFMISWRHRLIALIQNKGKYLHFSGELTVLTESYVLHNAYTAFYTHNQNVCVHPIQLFSLAFLGCQLLFWPL